MAVASAPPGAVKRKWRKARGANVTEQGEPDPSRHGRARTRSGNKRCGADSSKVAQRANKRREAAMETVSLEIDPCADPQDPSDPDSGSDGQTKATEPEHDRCGGAARPHEAGTEKRKASSGAEGGGAKAGRHVPAPGSPKKHKGDGGGSGEETQDRGTHHTARHNTVTANTRREEKQRTRRYRVRVRVRVRGTTRDGQRRRKKKNKRTPGVQPRRVAGERRRLSAAQ